MPSKKPKPTPHTPLLLPPSPSSSSSSIDSAPDHPNPQPRTAPRPTPPTIQGHSLTVRGVLVGLAVGTIICFSNMYFGLQTGWVSTMTMPASLLGFGIFRALGDRLDWRGNGPFTPVENVLVQTVAGSMAIMPLGW